MGKKMSMETAEYLAGKKKKSDSIYAPDNKYGYKINVNHPVIRPFYERYKQKMKTIILSDKQRHEFESIILKMIERSRNEQSNVTGQTYC